MVVTVLGLFAPESKALQCDSQKRITYTGPEFISLHEKSVRYAAIVTDGCGTIRKRIPSSEYQKFESVGEEVLLPGDWALPGWHDAHAHLYGIGKAMEELNLRGAKSVEEIQTRIREWKQIHPELKWIEGRGWDQNLFPKKAMPKLKDLNEFEEPIVLKRVDGHAAWVNEAALKILKPRWRRRRGNYAYLYPNRRKRPQKAVYVDKEMGSLLKKMPSPDENTLRRRITNGAQLASKAGLVALHDMGTRAEELRVLRQLDALGQLPLRVFSYLEVSSSKSIKAFPKLSQDNKDLRVSRVQLQGVKLFADGALGSRGARLSSPYSDRKTSHGTWVTSPKTLKLRTRLAQKLGAQVAIHGIGDAATTYILKNLVPKEADALPLRLEHAQIVNPRYDARITPSVVISMQPTHGLSDAAWYVDRLGGERAAWAYRWRDMMDSDGILVFGTDSPVESIDPRATIYAALEGLKNPYHQRTRRIPSSDEEQATVTEKSDPMQTVVEPQTVDAEQALKAISSDAAKALGLSGQLGTLKEGAQLDLTLLEGEWPHAPLSWRTTEIVGTTINGQILRP